MKNSSQTTIYSSAHPSLGRRVNAEETDSGMSVTLEVVTEWHSERLNQDFRVAEEVIILKSEFDAIARAMGYTR